MDPSQQYKQYERNKILTASPAELTLLLYQGAIKFGNIAKDAIEKGEKEKARVHIIKTQNIILEFRATLKMEYPIAKEMDRVYAYLLDLLIEVYINFDEEKLEECIVHLRSMRDTWQEVMRITKNGTQLNHN